MQILILGMHRSGTSATARLINMMGAYFAPEGTSMWFNSENPKGFWERKEVMRLNDALLQLQHCQWDRVGGWRFEATEIPNELRHTMRSLILEIDAHRPWFLKDPRLCLTLPYWRPLLEVPIAVIVYRDPLEIARSLQRRSASMSVEHVLALWEYHAVGMLNHTLAMPRIYVQHAELLQRPVKTCEAIYTQLSALGVRRLAMPDAREIRAFIDPALYRSRAVDSRPLSSQHQALAAMLRGEYAPPGMLTVSEESRRIMLQPPPPDNPMNEKPMTSQDEIRILQRIAAAIERLKPEQEALADIKSADAYTWDAARNTLLPVPETAYVDLMLLQGIGQARDTLLANTLQFAKGHSANNALLWGARGMGKSSLVKSIHAHVNKTMPRSLVLVEIHREDIHTLPHLLHILRGWVIRRFILFCDDLSFDANDTAYKSLKTILEGGIEGRPDHVLFYATSNRRHLMQRDMIENERSTAIHPGETVEEKVSLSDRFGLWLGFHACDQNTYLAIAETYAKHYKLPIAPEELRSQALEWAATRGARSGRVAWQFIQDLAGKMGKRV